ncbi:T-cell surface glycoprotein CD3 epsilon chain-like [Genypterus blacodes]|uniref:T-cell surface glycoprotein CD3 epsilon chain-like n=1 Tax=Genypterus blacodes TaxID=154954 RepID=UPI003F76A1A2
MKKMRRLGVWVVFAALRLISTVKSDDIGGVTFVGEHFTMRCPGTEGVIWYKDETKTSGSEQTLNHKYGQSTEGSYFCQYNETTADPINPIKIKTYHFFVRGKVCENCYELSGTLVAGVIAGDVVLTTMMILAIYKCRKTKNPTGSMQAAKARPHQARSRPQNDPSPYQELSTHTRANDPYSVVNRTG